MFKFKKTLPSRPEPPTWEMILDDLKTLPNDDVIFTVMKDLYDNPNEVTEAAEGPSNVEIFGKAKTFIETHDDLVRNMVKLKEEKAELIESTIDLEHAVNELKQQALAVLGKG